MMDQLSLFDNRETTSPLASRNCTLLFTRLCHLVDITENMEI